MRLEIGFTARPLVELHCEALVLLVFSDRVEEDPAILRLNESLSGCLMRIRAEGFWTGDEGETVLVSVPDAIPAGKILLKSLGTASAGTLEGLSRRMEETGDALQKMAVRDFAIRIPQRKGENIERPRLLEAACRHLMKPFMVRYRDEKDIAVRLRVSVDETELDQLGTTIRLLESHFKPLLRCSVSTEDREDPALAHGQDKVTVSV
jgi:hypothetical protein